MMKVQQSLLSGDLEDQAAHCAQTSSIGGDSGGFPFLATNGPGRATYNFQRGQLIYNQGDSADAVYYIHSGIIRLTVVAESGRQAIVGILGKGQFFGESALSKTIYPATASAMDHATVMRIAKQPMSQALNSDPRLANLFRSFLLSRLSQIEGDVLMHYFDSSEQRLAQVLLSLAQISRDGKTGFIPKISQDVLAARVGTTRSRVNVFMKRLRELGLIEYCSETVSGEAKIKVHNRLHKVASNSGADNFEDSDY